MGPEQADFLISQGVNPKKIQIGHMEGNLDLDYQKKVLDKGVFIAFDRIGLQVFGGCPMDPQRVETVLALIKAGYADQILLSHDFIQVWLGRPARSCRAGDGVDCQLELEQRLYHLHARSQGGWSQRGGYQQAAGGKPQEIIRTIVFTGDGPPRRSEAGGHIISRQGLTPQGNAPMQ